MKLRIAGYSYNEIRDRLGIPKSTLRTWFAELVLSKAANERLARRMQAGTVHLIRRNRRQTHDALRRAHEVQKSACMSVPPLGKRELLLVGATLYWAEGYKRPKIYQGKERASHPISFLNSDPDAVRIFVRFLEDVIQVPSERIRATMRLYRHINEGEARAYWSAKSGIPAARFAATTYLVSGASKGIRPYNRLPFGTLQIYVNDTQKFHRLMGLIEGLKSRL